MSRIFERATVPSANSDRYPHQEDRTSFNLKDARLERREEAKRRAQARKEKS